MNCSRVLGTYSVLLIHFANSNIIFKLYRYVPKMNHKHVILQTYNDGFSILSYGLVPIKIAQNNRQSHDKNIIFIKVYNNNDPDVSCFSPIISITIDRLLLCIYYIYSNKTGTEITVLSVQTVYKILQRRDY